MRRPLRVAVLTNMYPPHNFGGLEVTCQGVVDRFRSRGHDVRVLTSTVRHDGVDDPADELGLVHRDLRLYWDDHDLLSPSLWERARIERANQGHFARLLDEFRPDVLSVWGMGAVSLGLLTTAARRDVPIVFYVCDDWLEYCVRLDAWARLFAARPALGRVVESVLRLPAVLPELGRLGTYLWISERTQRFAEEHTAWTFPESSVVYCGIDERDFPVMTPDATREWRGLLSYVGRLDDRKGIDTAVRALAHLPGATLSIDGRGDAAVRSDLEALATDLGVADRVRFSVSDRADLADVYASADAVLFTSVWDEPFGLVPLEAMACNTPVVATGAGGSAEFLADDVNCLLYPAGDEVGLAAAVQRLAGDTGLRERLASEGRRLAGELSLDRLTDELEAWHRVAADRHAHDRPVQRVPPGTGESGNR